MGYPGKQGRYIKGPGTQQASPAIRQSLEKKNSSAGRQEARLHLNQNWSLAPICMSSQDHIPREGGERAGEEPLRWWRWR